MAILKREEISAMTYPQWVIDGVLPAESVSMIYGPSGKGKSFWVLDMAACVATGRKWHGLKVQQGPVIYVAGEGRSGYKARLEAWEKQHSTYAKDFCLEDEPVRLWSRTGQRDSLQQFIDRVHGAGLSPKWIVLDTLGTSLGGANESDNGHMRELLDNAEELVREWHTAVLLVHHTTKAETRAPRGAQALADGVAMHAYLHGDGKAYGVLDCTKQKDGEPFQPIRRDLHKVDLGKGASSLTFADDYKTGPRDQGRRRVTWPEIRSQLQGMGIPATPKLLATVLKGDRDAVWQALNRAAQRGEVCQPEEGSGAYVLVPGYVDESRRM